MFLASQLYFSLKQDVLTQEVVEQETREFANTISQQGEISDTSLSTYLKDIACTGNLYDFTIVHEKLCLEPEYRLKTADEIIDEQNKNYTGLNQYTYTEVISNPPKVNDEKPNDLTMNTETNESVIAQSTPTPASDGHVHNNACYSGTIHVHTNSCYKRHEHNSSCYRESYCSGTWSGYATYNVSLTCPNCGAGNGSHHNTSSSSVTFFCSSCKKTVTSSNSTPTGNYYGSCSKCGAGYAGSSNWSGSTHGTITTLSCGLGNSTVIECGKTEDYYDSNGNKLNPCCGQIMVSINPTHPTQTIYNGDRIITTATVTYLDGSTNVVICSSSFNNNQIGYGQIATITYYGLNSSTTKQTFTATVILNIIVRNTTCVNGHTYWLTIDGKDPGCPYCKAWLKSLSIVSPATGNLELYQGTSLESNGVILLATYLDGRQEYVSTGYAHNLDNVYIGTQKVTIGYKGKFVSLQIKVLRKLKQCTICNRFYQLYPDGGDPGCPYCLALVPVFTGNVMKYYTEYITDEILEEIDSRGTYMLNKGDEIRINVSNKTETLASKILSFLGIRSSNVIKVWTANEVRDEK